MCLWELLWHVWSRDAQKARYLTFLVCTPLVFSLATYMLLGRVVTRVRALISFVVLIFVVAFVSGRFQAPLAINDEAMSSIQLSDNRIFEGRIILSLSRYLILQRDDMGITIVPQANVSRVTIGPKREDPFRSTY
jgi:hypothetical protein